MSCFQRPQRGFTIIEMLVVVGIIAAGFFIVVPLFNSLSGARIREEASELARLIRGTYSEASLSGVTYRIVFEMKAQEDNKKVFKTSYWVEASREEARGDELVKEEDGGAKILDAQERERRKYLRQAEFLPLKSEFGQRRELSDSVRIFGVWIEGMQERLREGTAYLYFFPTGYTQRAQISLTDDEEGKNLYVLIAEPLTGEVVTENEEEPLK